MSIFFRPNWRKSRSCSFADGHFFSCLPPFIIMGGLLVFCDAAFIEICFDKNKTSRVIGLLNNVKAGNCRLFYAALCVFNTYLFKFLDIFRLNLNIYMNYEHCFISILLFLKFSLNPAYKEQSRLRPAFSAFSAVQGL